MTFVEKLSGGNQQKVVLAREVAKNVDLIIAAQPTRGLDVDATRFVFEIILDARHNGAGVLYISTELEEIMALSDTIGIIYDGRLVGALPGEKADVRTVGLLMAGEGLPAEHAI
jgi:simple sugar transport system ATP-binding protein